MTLVNELGAVALLAIGVYGIVTRRNLVQVVMCLSLLEASTYLLLVSFAARRGGTAPVLADPPKGTTVAALAHGRLADPVLQNFCLTAIVIGVAVTGLFLAIVVRIAQHFGSVDTDDVRELRG